jgi:hypothetical protein
LEFGTEVGWYRSEGEDLVSVRRWGENYTFCLWLYAASCLYVR